MPVDREPTLEEYLGNLMKHELAYREYETLKSRAESSEAVVREMLADLDGAMDYWGKTMKDQNAVEVLRKRQETFLAIARRHGLEVE
jgi:hypothetical protein